MNERQKKKKRKYVETFNTIDDLISITNLDRRFIDGQIIRILNPKDNEAELYKYKDGDFLPLREGVNTLEEEQEMTMYAANKQLFAAAPQFDEGQIARAEDLINEYGKSYGNVHYMLLGHDIRYYTVFIRNDSISTSTLGHEVIECLEYIGQIKEIINDEITGAIECWVTTYEEKETIVLYLFPYDTGMVHYGGFN